MEASLGRMKEVKCNERSRRLVASCVTVIVGEK